VSPFGHVNQLSGPITVGNISSGRSYINFVIRTLLDGVNMCWLMGCQLRYVFNNTDISLPFNNCSCFLKAR
jgi:hypothetical protein